MKIDDRAWPQLVGRTSSVTGTVALPLRADGCVGASWMTDEEMSSPHRGHHGGWPWAGKGTESFEERKQLLWDWSIIREGNVLSHCLESEIPTLSLIIATRQCQQLQPRVFILNMLLALSVASHLLQPEQLLGTKSLTPLYISGISLALPPP